jgi:signal transduction histidine kinase
MGHEVGIEKPAEAYVSIPFSLIQLVRKRKDLDFNWMFVMFGAFILACGATHFMNVWNIWHSAYRCDGVVKAITALASIPTAILMYRLVPKAVALPSAEELRDEIETRRRVEAEVRSLNADLERRVEERTALLQRSNAALQRFACVSSHDLQEPIRTIRTFNQLLAKEYGGKLDPKADQYIGFVVEASARMHNLVTNLLTYSRVLDPEAPKEVKVASCRQALDTVLLDLREQFRIAARISDRELCRMSAWTIRSSNSYFRIWLAMPSSIGGVGSL